MKNDLLVMTIGAACVTATKMVFDLLEQRRFYKIADQTFLLAEIRSHRFSSKLKQKILLGDRYDEFQRISDHIDLISSDKLAKEVLTGQYGEGKVLQEILGDRFPSVLAELLDLHPNNQGEKHGR